MGLRGAANTIRTYAGDWKRFADWCQLQGFAFLPAPAEALPNFLTELALRTRSACCCQGY